MNDDLNYETGLSKNAKIAIGVAAGVVLVGLIVGAVLIVRSRAGGGTQSSTAPQQPGAAGAVNAPAAVLTPAEQAAKSRAMDLKAAQDYNKSHPYVVDDSNIKYGVEYSLTPAEVQQMGYPPGTDIRYTYVKPGPDSVIQAPLKIYTKAPPSGPVTNTPPSKKPAVPPPASP